MNLCFRVSAGPSTLSVSQFSRNLCRSPRFLPSSLARRQYATQHVNRDSSLRLGHVLDQRSQGTDHVGPFPLGMSPSYGSPKPPPKWKDLNTKGKVFRSTVNTTNFIVILVGASLCCVLFYSLTSELFSPNSPTVLYGDACDRLEGSSRVKKYLSGSLSFHTEPPSSLRPRHRNRQVASTIVFDHLGREHMLLNFFVSSSPSNDLSYTERVSSWISTLGDTSAQELAGWIRLKTQNVWESGKSALRFGPQPATAKAQSWYSGFFGSLKAATAGGGNGHLTNPELDGRVFTEGEVHVDFLRNSDGYFVYRYLVVDLPGSSVRGNVRIYVERAPGVTDRDVYTR
ncbi:TIM21-domain-containing protein [Flagelloscypha sp. PMI_526]|nr:TIM21-domain-containing protein [Flagelloscypha sp. PMI_526]